MSRSLPLLSALLLLVACSDGAVQTNNSPPEASILAPVEGYTVLQGSDVGMRGVVDDDTTPNADLEVVWSSSIDGTLFEGNADEEGDTSFITSALSPGSHALTLQVIDKDGSDADASVNMVVIENIAPTIEILAPTADGRYFRTEAVDLVVRVADEEDEASLLRVTWTDGGSPLIEDLVPGDDGESAVNRLMGEGAHELVATVTDTLGRTGSDAVTIQVRPPNSAPSCTIDAPGSGDSAERGTSVSFEATVGDVDEPSDRLAVTWVSSLEGDLGPSSPASNGRVLHAHTFVQAGTHTITMRVTDSEGETCTANLLFDVSTPPAVSITAPLGGAAFNAGASIAFAGTAHDAEQPDNTLLVTWESDLEGLLDDTPPTGTGALAFNAALDAGTHLVTLRVEDEHGLVGTDTVTLAINAPPSAPVVSINPASPTSTQALTLSIDVPSVDPEGASVSYDVDWLLGGVPQAAWSGVTVLPASATTSGQTWTVSVTGDDGAASSPPGTASVTIIGSAPSISGVAVSPAVGLATSTFTATPSGWYDADGDPPGYLYQWSLAGSPVTGATGATFVPVGGQPGAAVTVAVTPWDGGNAGSPLTGSASVNSLPTVGGVTLGPGPAYEGSTLTATYAGVSDPDGQAVSVTWEWEVDGALVVGQTGSTLTGAWFDRGDTVVAWAEPFDGLQSGTAVASSGLVIQNTVPGAPGLTIDPQQPGETDDLWCEVTTPSADADGDAVVYTMTWTVDGAPFSGTSTDVWPGDTVPGSATADQEVWECTATPSDTIGTGAVGTDSVTVQAGSCPGGLAITVEGIGGNFEVCTTCTIGAYSCQARQVCESVTGQTCVHQSYDCATGSQGSWYPQGGSGGSNFNFAYAYDFWSSNYGNICDCNPDDSTQYGLYRGHQYCGTGHWFRQ